MVGEDLEGGCAPSTLPAQQAAGEGELLEAHPHSLWCVHCLACTLQLDSPGLYIDLELISKVHPLKHLKTVDDFYMSVLDI